MTRDEQWNNNYDAVMRFMRKTHHRPSRHRKSEYKMVNWYKHNKRLLLRNEMPLHRQEKFKELMKLADKLLRVNQYAYKEIMPRQFILNI